MLCAGRVTNDIETIESSANGIIFSDISDHLPIVHVRSFKTHKMTTPVKEFICKRIINNFQIKTFTGIMKSTSWENVFSSNDASESYNGFFDVFSTVYEQSFPLTRKKVKKY